MPNYKVNISKVKENVMTSISKRGLLFGIVGLWMSVSGHAYSSVITPVNPNVALMAIENGTIDLVSLNPANASGVSINYFSDFVVESKPLRMVNVPSYNGTDESQELGPADLIVIIADDIKIKNAVTLLGPATDIVFITNTPSGGIECINCTLNNFLRVSLVAAYGATLNNSTAELGELRSGLISTATLNNVYAPGVIGFDVMANDISVNGVIDIHTRALSDARGGYTNVAHGNVLIGTGQVNLMIGDLAWNYDTDQVTEVDAYSGSHFIDGAISSTGVKITASGDLFVDTNIDTRTDLISSITYKGGTHIPLEKIDIMSFAGGGITLNGSLNSDGIVKVMANGELSLSASSYIDGSIVELIAGDAIVNLSDVTGESVSLAGDRVINEGNLEGRQLVEVWAQNEVMNQYGGYISGDTVKLISKDKVVRNGSRTPYISRGFEANDLLSLLQNSYVAGLNVTRLGTYYALNFNPAEATGVSMAANNTAHISARSLEISAVGFENINPYYKPVTDGALLELSRERLDQVRISAEDYLAIKASSYVVNSSAQMRLNNPTGIFAIDTAVFVNERYRVDTVLGFESTQTTSSTQSIYLEIAQDVTVTDTEVVGTHTVVYSPPGSLVVMGRFENRSTQSFLNNMAYFEVFGDAVIDTPYIKDFGLENQGIAHSSSMTSYINLGELEGFLGRQSSESTQTIDPNELDSLFYVHGDFIANAAYLENDGNALFANHSPLDYFINQAIDSIMEENYENNRFLRADDVTQEDIDIAKLTDDFNVDWSRSEDIDYYEAGYYYETALTVVETGTETFSLFDELKKLFDSMSESISTFFDEIVWWE